jgi:hypothetical protein
LIPGEIVFKREKLFLIFFFILVDVEIFELITGFGIRNNSEPISEVVSLQVFLAQVLEVSLGEVDIS